MGYTDLVNRTKLTYFFSIAQIVLIVLPMGSVKPHPRVFGSDGSKVIGIDIMSFLLFLQADHLQN